MSDLTFHMRLSCNYTSTANNVDRLQVEHMVEDEWKILELNTHSPGFDIFMYSILTCQHMYFRLNAAERNLILDSSEGFITVCTDTHRNIDSLQVNFKGRLKSGNASEDDIAYIKERMTLCPVSTNLKDIADTETVISFV